MDEKDRLDQSIEENTDPAADAGEETGEPVPAETGLKTEEPVPEAAEEEAVPAEESEAEEPVPAPAEGETPAEEAAEAEPVPAAAEEEPAAEETEAEEPVPAPAEEAAETAEAAAEEPVSAPSEEEAEPAAGSEGTGNGAPEGGEPPRKKRFPIKRVLLGLILLLVIGGGVWFWQYASAARADGRFLYATSVNGVNVAGLTPDEAAETVRSAADRSSLVLKEKGKTVLEGKLEDYGYALDEEALTAQYAEIRDRQLSDYLSIARSIFMSTDFAMDNPAFELDEKAFREKVCAASLSEDRIPNENAYLDYDKDAGKVVIVPEVQGTELDDGDLQTYVSEQIEGLLSQEGTEWKLEMDIPEDFYKKPAVLSDDETLTAEENALNAYAGSDITYEFGETKEHLGFDTLWTWFTVKDGKAELDPAKPEEYVQELEGKYNTRYLTRVFKTTYGQEIEFRPGRNEYGYTIKHDEEVAQLKKDILSGKAVSREPIYYEKNSWGNPYYLKRNGTDDLAGTYVECNLSAQHLWYYRDGELFLETDFVSGNTSKNRGTATGVFPLAYKESPSVLTGGNAEEGEYETKVNYWMPFYEGQGLHDATWRSYFGGSIYRSNGSHGCINLPLWAAQTIYNNITPGTAILIYY